MINKIFGPSIHLLVLDLFLEDGDELLNLREVARRVDKNPGSISRVMPTLIENGFVEQIQVGKNTYVYRLNKEDETVKLILEFSKNLRKLKA